MLSVMLMNGNPLQLCSSHHRVESQTRPIYLHLNANERNLQLLNIADCLLDVPMCASDLVLVNPSIVIVVNRSVSD